MASTCRARTTVRIPTGLSLSEAFLLSNSTTIPRDKIIFEEAFSGRTISYGQFLAQVKSTAAWLKRSLAFQHGQIVSIISLSSIDYVVAVHAVWWAGGVVSLINDALTPKEIAYGLDIVKPIYVIVGSSAFDKLAQSLRQTSAQTQVLAMGTSHPQWPRLADLEQIGTEPLEQDPEPYSLKDGDNRQVLATVILSSGTTGHPKAVMLSHHNIIAANYQLRADNPDNWRSDMREIFFPPLSHVYALYVVMTGAPWLGYYVCLMPRFSLERYCQLMSERGATLARLVPPVAKMLAESPVTRRYKYPALEYFTCSAAPLTEKTADELRKVFPGVGLCQTYGCTETSGACVQSGTRDVDMPLNATGRLIANMEMRFLDPNGNEVEGKGGGEITLRGPNVMMAYLGNPKATAEHILDGGWYKTGDIGYVDNQGYLFITGRTKDIIKYNGFQVAPRELEEILVQHPLVGDAAVCGVWSETHSSDLPRAYIVLAAPSTPAEKRHEMAKSISAFLSSQVAGYKQLRGGIAFVESLPKSSTGKVLRRLLTQQGQSDSAAVLAKL